MWQGIVKIWLLLQIHYWLCFNVSVFIQKSLKCSYTICSSLLSMRTACYCSGEHHVQMSSWPCSNKMQLNWKCEISLQLVFFMLNTRISYVCLVSIIGYSFLISYLVLERYTRQGCIAVFTETWIHTRIMFLGEWNFEIVLGFTVFLFQNLLATRRHKVVWKMMLYLERRFRKNTDNYQWYSSVSVKMLPDCTKVSGPSCCDSSFRGCASFQTFSTHKVIAAKVSVNQYYIR